MRALVVDDSRTTRRILAGILREVGFDEVAEAGDGVDGLEKIRSMERPDLVLVDWNMPEMNGIQFVRYVRTRAEFSAVPIMMVTTETEFDHVSMALEAGANEYVMKPFTKEIIAEKLSLLGISR